MRRDRSAAGREPAGDRRGEARNLPAVPGAADLEPGVLDGQVVGNPPAVPPSGPLRVMHIVVQHEQAKRAGRHLGYVPLGAAVIARRLWLSRSTSRYEKWLAVAEATGNHEAALEWEARLAAFRRDRHQRRLDMIQVPAQLLLQLPKLALGLFAVLAAIGTLLAIATRRMAEASVPVEVLAHVVLWVAVAFSVAWGPLVLGLPWIALGALWHVGRTASASSGPAWLRTSSDPDTDVSIDETTIAAALDALRIQQITVYLKGGLPLQYLVPCRRDGRGTHAVIRLPAGVTAERIARRRADLATGLYRLAKEVWPVTGAEAGILDLWVADKGALAEGAGPYPLLDDGTADYFRPVPFGRTLRGDPIGAPLAERNTLAGGMPGQGKSSAARVIMAGAALDPTAELRIWVPDTNFDFEVFRPRCSRYVMGAEDEFIGQIRDDLRELRAEVQTRGQLLIDHEVPAVTRELASAGVGLHPLVCLLEEAHVAITHPVHGKEISGLLTDVVKLGRKRAIHLIVSTQAPTRDSMPRDVTRNCSNGIAFAVGDHVANDALLGQGAYAAGHRATELIPGTDRGTALVKGFSGERSDIVQVYFLDVTKGSDQVTPIIERSLDELRRLGRLVPGTGRTRGAIEMRDLFDDLGQVLNAERVRLADVPALLRELAPAWGPYRTLTGVQLRELLDDAGVRTTNVGNVPRLDPADLRRALGEKGELGQHHLSRMHHTSPAKALG
jgi:S-DNA-T family DNA segregation ATPase FtsK/SpoIIIE